jgi:anti-anti-sigma factor
MNIKKHLIEGCAVLDLFGRVKPKDDDFKKEFISATENEKRIVINCSNLSYVDSMGLRVFLLVLKNLNEINGKMALCCLPPLIREIIAITGFLQVFEVFETEEEAIKYME